MTLDLSLPHDPDYGYLNGLAHNRTVTWVRAPALVCHVGFWYPGIHIKTKKLFTTSAEFDEPGEREKWKTKIDVAIGAVLTNLDDAEIASRTDCALDDSLVFFNNVSNLGQPSVFVNKMNLSPSVESMLKDDRRTINIYCDTGSIKFSIKFQVHSEYLSVSYFLELDQDFFEGRGQAAEELPPTFLNDEHFLAMLNKHGLAIKEKCNCHPDDLAQPEVDPISKFFFIRAWDHVFKHLPKEIDGDARDSPIGKRFADFRGLILSDETIRLPVEPLESARPLTWGQRATELFAPFVSQSDRHETTASYMLDGRAFYITSLGYNRSQLSVNSNIPLKYLMYVHQTFPGDRSRAVVNKWQLGRLIDRLFDLGTCRLAALVDLKELRRAGEQLAELEPLTQRARNAINEGRQYETRERILEVHKKINELNIRNGIQYRVERSRYYVERFQAGLPGLRLHRIEGYQPYDRFVEQRLGASFDFVNRLGRRYERAATAVARLAQDGLLLQLNNIQKLGELFIVLFLLPYYTGNLIEHIFGAKDWRVYATVWAIWAAIAVFRTEYKEIINNRINEFEIKFIRVILKGFATIFAIGSVALLVLILIISFHVFIFDKGTRDHPLYDRIWTELRFQDLKMENSCREASDPPPPTSAPSCSQPPR